MPARALAFIAALLLVLLSLGVTGSAFADPGSGKALGKDNGNGNDGGGSQAASSFAAVDNGTAGNGSSGTNGNGNGADNGNGPGVNNGNGGSAGNASGNAGQGNSSAAANVTTSTAAASSSDTTAGGASNNGQAKKQSSFVAPAKSNSGKGQATSNGSSTAQSHKTKGTAGTSGDVSQPQPQSNADQNSGGANGKCPGGPYCSTRQGLPSGNGNGGGKAVGKPCAGCVGKADNKNPKGQYPGPSDHNKGYECDGNNGIGKTNPAHTGCTPPPCTVNCTPPPPCTENCTPCEQTNSCKPPCEQTNSCKPPCKPTTTQDSNCNELPPCVVNPNGPGCVPPPNYCQQHPDKCVPPPGYCTTSPDACPPPVDYCTTNPDACVPASWCEVHPMSKACVPPPTIEGEEAVLPRPPVVKGIEAFRPPARKPAVAPAQAGALPSTGAEAGMGLATLGGFALLAVGVATLLSRRRTS